MINSSASEEGALYDNHFDYWVIDHLLVDLFFGFLLLEENIMKPTQAKQVALSVLQGNNTPFFLGGTGIGKSAIVESIAHELSGDRKLVRDAVNPKANEFGFIDFRLSLYESVDLGGLPYIDDGNVQKRAFLGNLPQGGEGVLFFDEYSQAHGSLQSIVGQIIYEGRIGEYQLPDGWKVIYAGN